MTGQPPVEGRPILAVTIAGVAVNLAATWVLARANRSSLNIQGAFRHILTDLYGFIGTVAAAIIILATGFSRADAIASLVVVALMVKAAWELLRESGHVRDMHDLHVWTLATGLPTLSAHVAVEDSCFTDAAAPRLLDELQACRAGHFDVEHCTFQLEPASHAAHEPGTHP